MSNHKLLMDENIEARNDQINDQIDFEIAEEVKNCVMIFQS